MTPGPFLIKGQSQMTTTVNALPAAPAKAEENEVSTDSQAFLSFSRLSSIGGAADEELADDAPGSALVEWVRLVERIRTGETDGMEELYKLFSRGIRFYLCRQLGAQELDDKVHDTFLVVVHAIKRGELREPERLMGFVRTIVRRQVAAHIDKVVHDRRDQSDLDTGSKVADPRGTPEQAAISREKFDLLKQVMDEMTIRDREILTRFYLHEESQEQICDEMNLTDTQFRLLKSRAKARFGELGKKKLASRSLGKLFVRTSASGRH